MRVRAFHAADRDAVHEVSVRAGAGSPSGVLWGDPESEMAVYLDPYMDLEPDSLLLAESDGRLVGYLAGCLDGTRFPSEEERIERAIRTYRLLRKRTARAFFLRSAVDMAAAKLRRRPTAGDFVDARWPSHLHIGLVPEARGTGAAEALMRRWFERLDAHGSPGCHLQTLVENTRAVRFFTRTGFVTHGVPAEVPGLRYRGARVHQLTMVRPG
ncbi:GNAT family N-acetyltransferase [Nocardia otitidiscaviarum]|uniref:GNAT family N-acetyltransferase n=1 Tax=Nocardia otitidiscaviarum TaxID=1823 RepID=A0A516NIW6_9NOCA|nr:GNAT family N-acetyltransferase [Nocardia otitidiscaviarum]MCP9619723.1 GNAT family N-acetyltransferase [Nocardia otitidiscaviarum]QDP78843.1 GNAT family N-acetyltransferase [Nocardia otitidiscaviarum]